MIKLSSYISFKSLYLIAALALATWWVTQQHNVQLSLPNLHSFSCLVKQPAGDQDFNVYMPTSWQAKPIAQQLCNHTLVNSTFGSVTVSWQPRESLTSEDLLSKHFHLIWHRETSLTGLFPNWRNHYHSVMTLPNYSVSLFSQQPITQFSKALFSDKHTGLLNDQKSHSGYLIFKEVLLKKGIALTEQQVIGYSNRERLIQDFLNQKLDFISSSSIHPNLSHWPKSQTFPLATNISMGQWFMLNQSNSQLDCNVQKTLAAYLGQLHLSAQSAAPNVTCEV